MDQFANDTPEQRDEAFQEAAARLGMSKAIIEKDFWVCWSLKQLFALPSFGDHMIFKGGTSLGARGVHLPAEVREISPYVHQAFPDLLGSGGVDVKVLGVERTFWEKATILHMLYHQDPAKPLADRMSRHYYDMAQLIGHEAKERAVGSLGLLDQVAHHKSVFFKAAWANYEKAKPGSLRLMPNEDLTAALRRDYSGMREMIIGDAPSFDDILGAIEAFEGEINS